MTKREFRKKMKIVIEASDSYVNYISYNAFGNNISIFIGSALFCDLLTNNLWVGETTEENYGARIIALCLFEEFVIDNWDEYSKTGTIKLDLERKQTFKKQAIK